MWALCGREAVSSEWWVVTYEWLVVNHEQQGNAIKIDTGIGVPNGIQALVLVFHKLHSMWNDTCYLGFKKNILVKDYILLEYSINITKVTQNKRKVIYLSCNDIH